MSAWLPWMSSLWQMFVRWASTVRGLTECTGDLFVCLVLGDQASTRSRSGEGRDASCRLRAKRHVSLG
jgi:hypothetical protein